MAVGLGGCADSNGLALARQACQHVERSFALYRASVADPDPARASALAASAEEELRTALPLAAVAAGEAPQWQALMTTLGETSSAPESELIPALRTQCAEAESNGLLIPNSPSVPPTAPATSGS